VTRRGFMKRIALWGAVAAFPVTWSYRKAKRVFTGAKAKIYVNGQLVGYATDVTYTREPGQAIHAIANYEPIIESQPQTVEFTATVTKVGGNFDELFGEDT